jgi:hypothetical protein
MRRRLATASFVPTLCGMGLRLRKNSHFDGVFGAAQSSRHRHAEKDEFGA